MSPHFTEPNALHIVLHICYTTKGNNTCHFAIFSGLKVVQNEQLLSPLTSFTNLSILQIFWMDWFQSQLTFLFQKKWKRVQCPKWGIVPLRRTGAGRITHTFLALEEITVKADFRNSGRRKYDCFPSYSFQTLHDMIKVALSALCCLLQGSFGLRIDQDCWEENVATCRGHGVCTETSHLNGTPAEPRVSQHRTISQCKLQGCKTHFHESSYSSFLSCFL